MKRFLLFLIGIYLISIMLSSCTAGKNTHDLATESHLYEKISMIEIPYRHYSFAKKIDEKLYITVRTGEKKDTLIALDPISSKEKQILEAPEGIGWIEINENWLVWESDHQLLARPLLGGETRLLDSSQEIFAPALAGDSVAWFGKRTDEEYNIVVHDLKRRVTHKIAEIKLPCFYNNFVDFDGNKILWTDIIDGKGFYRVANVQDGVIRDFQVTEKRFRYPGYAELAGNCFYSINFDNYKEWDWTIQQFGYYSTESGTFTPVIKEGYINSFRVCSDRVAVIIQGQRLLLYNVQDPTKFNDLSNELGVTFSQLDKAGKNTFIAEVLQLDKKSTKSKLCIITVP